MTFTALAVGFILACAAIGLARPQRGSIAGIAASLAAMTVGAQLVLLLTR